VAGVDTGVRLRSRLLAAAVLVVLLFGLSARQAFAPLPTVIHWRGEIWQVYLVYNMNPAHPNPTVERLLGRTKALDRSGVGMPPWEWKPLRVDVYKLPSIDRNVAVYVRGGHVGRELLVRDGWRVKPDSPIARVMNFVGKVPG
jgi:hypothetical protein